MRSVLVLAALSCATLVAAQDDSPEAPPLHPPSKDDPDSSSTTTTTTTSTTSTTEVDSKTSQPPPKPTTEEEVKTTEPAPEPTAIEPELSSTIQEDYSISTQTQESSFVTIHTETPGGGSPTDTGSPPIATAAGAGLNPSWMGWASVLSVLLAAGML